MKKIIVFLILIAASIIIAYITGYDRKAINYITGIEEAYQKKEVVVKKEKNNIKRIEELDSKINSYFTYKIRQDHFEIKDFNELDIELNKAISFNYEDWNKSKEIKELIDKNIYNSDLNQIFIRVNYENVKDLKKNILFKFKMRKYINKGYFVNYIVFIEQKNFLNLDSNYILNNLDADNINLVYNLDLENRNIFYIYKKLRKFESELIKKKPGLNLDIGINSSKNNKDFENLKKIILYNDKVLGGKYIIEINDNDVIDEKLYDKIKQIGKLIGKNNFLLLDLNLNKDNIEKLDINNIFNIIKDYNIKIILPNVYYLLIDKQIKDEDFLNELLNIYKDIEKEKIYLSFYKYQNQYYKTLVDKK